jgi:hypothetical protein
MSDNFLKTLAVGILVILLIFTLLPMVMIDVIGKFAIGWLVMDLVSYWMDR